MAYITLDFGSSSSGAILNASGKNYNPGELIYVHRKDGNLGWTKQPSVFWIKRDLLDKSNISESDIKVFSCVFYEEEKYAASANFIWCIAQTKLALKEKIVNSEDWVCVKHPKMELYKLGNQNPITAEVRTTDGSKYPLRKVLHIFFMVIKKECMQRASEAGLILTAEEINWAVTLPGLAIWHQEAVQTIKEIAKPIYGDNLTLLSEPESAIIGINLAEGGNGLDFVENRYSIVVDLGGGTADICVMHETQNADGTTTFDEVKSTKDNKDATTSERAGGNDIDRRFISFFCEYLAEGIGMNDTIWLYSKFQKECPADAIEFDNAWHMLQFSDAIEDETVYFSPGRPYIQWLKTNCLAAANKRDEFGTFPLNGEELQAYVFAPVHEVILRSVEENLLVLKQKGLSPNMICFAGGLSLDKKLKKLIKRLSGSYFPYAICKECGEGLVVGAIQRGGNHILVNKDRLIRRMSRKTFYTQFAIRYNGDMESLREFLSSELRNNYYKLNGIWLSDEKLKKILDEQMPNISIDYSQLLVRYLAPFCLRFAPVNREQSYNIVPLDEGNQTGLCQKVFSADKDFILFKNNDVKDEGMLEYDFGYNWHSATITFDPISNAIEGTAILYLTDENGNKLKDFVIKNVSKRGI